MTCGTRVLWRDARRKGNGAPYRKAVRHYHSGAADGQIPADERGRLEVCDGHIVANIAAVNEPEWGGSYAALDIAYKCETCGATIFPHLPQNAEQLSIFVSEAIVAKTPKGAEG